MPSNTDFHSINISFLIQRCFRLLRCSITSILPQLRLRIRFSSNQKRPLTIFHISIISFPSKQTRFLQSTSKTKGCTPWKITHFIDCIQINGCFLFTLTSTQELPKHKIIQKNKKQNVTNMKIKKTQNQKNTKCNKYENK